MCIEKAKRARGNSGVLQHIDGSVTEAEPAKDVGK